MKKQLLAQARVLAGVLLFAATFGANHLYAQATGAISGTITDASGAAIPDAQIQVKNNGTGAGQTSVSDAQGRYRVPELIIGDYDVQATKTGFSTVLRKGVTPTVGSQPVVDIQLAVGQQTQTVTVQGEVSQVETQSTAVGALVEAKQIADLPLNGRNFTQLITLAPGVTQIRQGAPGAGSTFYGNGQKYSIAGSRPSGQAYLLDDQDMTNFWNNGPGAGGLGTALGVEAIAEFQALTNTYSTQFGGNGAVINAAKKSGTNAFHGSAFEFLRNDKLEARNFYDGASAPPFRQNQFGGSVGGPIKKDKLFFFTTYEGLRNHRDTTWAPFQVGAQWQFANLRRRLPRKVCSTSAVALRFARPSLRFRSHRA
ncbi:MAG: carboxypeptidase regulatory-like domain-containing protein [Bryobacteraceae bacterium]